jgi:diphthamide biosynthesis protein 2
MSRIDRQINLDRKGKSPARPSDDALPSGEEEDNTPADGVSELLPAPTPEGLVPSTELPTKPDPPTRRYELPEGVEIEDCAIWYLGGESLGLNNLLITHGKCPVRSLFLGVAVFDPY